MVKKVILGVVFAGLIGALVFGAINRTVAMAGDDIARTERETGTELVYEGSEGRGAAGEPQGQGRNRRDASDLLEVAPSGEQSGGGSGSNGRGGAGARGYGNGGGVPDPQAEIGDTISLTGSVAAMNVDGLLITLADGSSLVVEGRAWSFAQELGFTAAAGDALVLAGFYEDDGSAYEVISIQNQTSGVSVTLREASGQPGWAGNGRGGNSSH